MFCFSLVGRSLTYPSGTPLRLSSKKLGHKRSLHPIAAPIAAIERKWQVQDDGDTAEIGRLQGGPTRGHEPARLALLRSGIPRGGEAGVPTCRAAGRLPRERNRRARRM